MSGYRSNKEMPGDNRNKVREIGVVIYRHGPGCSPNAAHSVERLLCDRAP